MGPGSNGEIRSRCRSRNDGREEMAQFSLDVTGEICPYPLILTRKEMGKLQTGDQLAVTAFLISLIIAVLGLALRAEAGGRVYTANMESGTISVIDPDSMKVIATIDPLGHRTHGLLLSPDQSKLFATHMHNKTLSLLYI